MSNELKPVRCGCGGEAKVHEHVYGKYEVYCPRCFIETDDYYTEAEAIAAWNRAMGERMAKVKYIVHAHGYPDEGLCGNCNEDVNGLYDYCPYCGARLEWE